MSAIKYFGFAKESSSLPIYGLINDKTVEQAIKDEVPKVIARLKDLYLIKEQRQKVTSSSGLGCWFCKRDSQGMFYLTLCIEKYPERHIYAGIAQLKDHLALLGEYENEPDATLKLHAKDRIRQIVEKYENVGDIDKVSKANKLLDGIKDDITDSTLKLMNNTVNLESLQRKTTELKENAQMFEANATEIEREMWCRNCKMKVIIVLVVIALICVIVIPIATTVGK